MKIDASVVHIVKEWNDKWQEVFWGIYADAIELGMDELQALEKAWIFCIGHRQKKREGWTWRKVDSNGVTEWYWGPPDSVEGATG